MQQRIEYLSILKDRMQNIFKMQSDVPEHQQVQFLDNSLYLKLRQQVLLSDYYGGANRHIKIRILNWIKVLDKVDPNKVWQANRDNYIKLLAVMCYCGVLIRPFHQLPLKSDPNHLPKHQINQIFDLIETELRIQKTNRLSSKRNSHSQQKNSFARLKTTETQIQDHRNLLLMSRKKMDTLPDQPVIRKGNGLVDIPLQENDSLSNSFDLSENDKEETEQERLSRIIAIKVSRNSIQVKSKPLMLKQENSIKQKKRISICKTQAKVQMPVKKQTTFKKNEKNQMEKVVNIQKTQKQNKKAINTLKYTSTVSVNEPSPQKVQVASYRQKINGCTFSVDESSDNWLVSFFKKMF